MTEESLFDQALNTAEAERGALLDRACAGQPELRNRLEALLAADALPRNLLRPAELEDMYKTGAFEDSPGTMAVVHAGAVIAGKYKLLQQIGEGGMGTVWMADQTEPVKRRVAVKLIHAERGTSKTILARFEAERQAIALMDHPHIAKLLDAGTTSETHGAPFFIMELVKGVPLTEYCDAHRLSIPERLTLFIQICSAVQHAHQKGIIHRDLKPSNILVESHDGKPVPKVIDFGLAKATSGLQLTEHSLFTGFGTVMGTPLYMSPEQATFNAVDVDTRADVYALGVILYELLTGTTPITRETVKKAALDEMMRIIREQDAPTPSSRLSTSETKPAIAANRQSEPVKLGRFVKGELDWIVLKALSKERDRRYETANGFAKDIERFLNHEPVVAGPVGRAYKLRKFVRRNRGQVVAAGLVLFAMLTGITGTTLALVEAKRQERFASDEMIGKEIALKAEADQREIAETNARASLEAAIQERQAKEREAEQRSRAEKARDRTRDALDAMTSSATGDLLTTQQAITDEQKKFLVEVLTYYREFVGENADDERSRSRQAQAAGRVGTIEYRLGRLKEAASANQMARDLYESLATDFPALPKYRQNVARSENDLAIQHMGLGNVEQAENEYRKAVEIQKKLVLDFPNVPAYRQELARSRNNLAILLERHGKPEASETEHRDALEAFEKLVADFPQEPEYREALAISASGLSGVLLLLGRPAEAEKQLRKGVANFERLAEDFPTVAKYSASLALGYTNLATIFVQVGRYPAAEEHYRKSVAINKILAADFPLMPNYRQGLATSRNNLALLLMNLGRRDEAETEIRLVLSIREKLVDDFPKVPENRVRLGNTYGMYGTSIRDEGKSGESLKWFELAIETLRPVCEKQPRNVFAKESLRNSYGNRAQAFDELKRHAEALKDWDRAIELSSPAEQLGLRASRVSSRIQAGLVAEAVAEADELTKSPNWNFGQWYDFARVYAIASVKIAAKKQQYADKAMEFLRKVVEAGLKDVARLKNDPHLDPLRERDDFKKLIAVLEKK